MENKKISYFSNAIEFLADEINNQDLEAFYRSCISELARNNRLEKPTLRDMHSSKERDEKTYGNYMDKLIRLLSEYKDEIANRNAELGLTKRPIIKTHTGGGSGNPTYYYIDVEEYNIAPSVAIDNKKEPKLALNGDITYRTKSLKRTPWYLRIGGKFFTKTKHRQIFLFSVLIYFIGAPISLGFLLAQLPLWLWGLLVACYYISFKPAWNIMHLSINKLTLLEHIFQPVGAVCISKVSNVANKEEYLDIDREIMSVIVDGTCPICLNQYNLKNSVQLEPHSLFNRRIIGKCLNNPKEHKYSFDKDLMTGQRIENN